MEHPSKIDAQPLRTPTHAEVMDEAARRALKALGMDAPADKVAALAAEFIPAVQYDLSQQPASPEPAQK
jgi:hypothetical protein